MKVNLLKSKIVAAGYTTSSFLNLLAKNDIEMSKSAWYRKVKGETEFTRDELEVITNVLDLSAIEFQKIFLNS